MRNVPTMKDYYRRRLEEMKRSNNMIEQAIEQRDYVNNNIANCRQTLRNLKAISESLQTKNNNYIRDIIFMIEEAVAFAVNSVLPLKQYTVELNYVPYRNNGQLKLYLVNEQGQRLPPKIIEGDMLNQVLSFSSITHITVQMGYDTVFYDEAFASANVRSLALINTIISYYNNMGINFVFVSQNPILYAGLQRTMVELISDGKQVVQVNKIRVEPEEEEMDVVKKVTELFDGLTHN